MIRILDTDDDSFQQATDVFNITSLYGYKLSDNFAISALGEYRTTFLSNFNDPGYLDLGVGGYLDSTGKLGGGNTSLKLQHCICQGGRHL